MASHGAPSAHRLLFHKIKGNRLSGWDRIHERRGCPHCPAIGADGGSVFHIVWACPRAQDRWQQLINFWSPLHTERLQLFSRASKTNISSLTLQSMPDRLWLLPGITRLGAPRAHDTVATALAMNAVWRRQVLATCHSVWRWRTTPDTADEIWSSAHASARLGAALLAASNDVRWARCPNSAATKFTAAALDALFSSTPLSAPLAPASGTPDATYLLFFDGGSRGNPGPGGSGAVLVRVDELAVADDSQRCEAVVGGRLKSREEAVVFCLVVVCGARTASHGRRPDHRCLRPA